MNGASDSHLVPFTELGFHPILSQFMYGIELDVEVEVDGAWFVTWETSPIPVAAAAAIRIQVRAGTSAWKDAGRADGSVFPSHGGETAAVGWYNPIRSFMTSNTEYETRALVPATWDLIEPTPQHLVPRVDYFSDWRTKEWACDCGWSGSNSGALVYHDLCFVSIACPACGHGIATINRNPSETSIQTSASLNNPEARALLSPDNHGDPYIGGDGKVVFVTGSEEVVRFEEGDQFFGVHESWLLPRLRPKLELEYIDLFERGGFHINLDNELIEDIDPIACLGEFRGELCTYGDGNSLGGSFNLYEEWVEALAYELFWNLTRIDTKLINLHDLALEKLVEGMDPWDSYSEDQFEVTSPYLKADNPQDISVVLGLAGYASEVYLNGTLLER